MQIESKRSPAMRGAKQQQRMAAMKGASAELERRSQYLSSLIRRTKLKAEEDDGHEKAGQQQEEGEEEENGPGGRDRGDGAEEAPGMRVSAADMPLAMQKRAFQCTCEVLASMPKLDNKYLSLALKKEFDSSFGPAWHCIVGEALVL